MIGKNHIWQAPIFYQELQVSQNEGTIIMSAALTLTFIIGDISQTNTLAIPVRVLRCWNLLIRQEVQLCESVKHRQ